MKAPKWLPIVDDMAMILSQADSPKSTSALFDMWWDHEVKMREQRTGVGQKVMNKAPRGAPSCRELSMWLRRDERFHNLNEGPRSSGRSAMWIYQEAI